MLGFADEELQVINKLRTGSFLFAVVTCKKIIASRRKSWHQKKIKAKRRNQGCQ
jgi:hypothetical protein